MPHTPILVTEFLSFFEGKSIHTFIDATLGAGGHAKALLDAHPEIACFIGIDQDPHALLVAKDRLQPYLSKAHLLHGNFFDIDTLSAPFVSKKIDGIFADFGVSSMQLDQKERGFSFQENGPLDMRMNPQNSVTAEEIVNRWSQKELEHILKDYGEEKRWRRCAEAIVAARPLHTTEDLVKAIEPVVGKKRWGKMHPATLVFQAIRIAVNQELEAIEQFLPKAFQLLAPMGLFGILSFHSLEDRLVKNFFRKMSGYMGGRERGDLQVEEPKALILTKRPICPGEEEIRKNKRSRSAKLRFLKRI